MHDKVRSNIGSKTSDAVEQWGAPTSDLPNLVDLNSCTTDIERKLRE